MRCYGCPDSAAAKLLISAILLTAVAIPLACAGILIPRRPRYPTNEELTEATTVVQKLVQKAEAEGVWYGYPDPGRGASRSELETVFRVYARLAEDFPTDGGPVGVFLADVLLPGLLRAIDATKAAGLPGGVLGLEHIAGGILGNDYALGVRATELEHRLIEGEDGFGSLYWPRDYRAGLTDEVCRNSMLRYQAILARCEARKEGCLERVRTAIQASIDELQGFLAGAERPRRY